MPRFALPWSFIPLLLKQQQTTTEKTIEQGGDNDEDKLDYVGAVEPVRLIAAHSTSKQADEARPQGNQPGPAFNIIVYAFVHFPAFACACSKTPTWAIFSVHLN